MSDTCTVTVTNYLFAPKLDGTDSISDWGSNSHSYTVSNNIITGRNVQFDETWDNTIDWELSYDVKAQHNTGIHIVESTQTTQDKYCLQILEDGNTFYNYKANGTSNTQTKNYGTSSQSDYINVRVRKELGNYYIYLNDSLWDTVTVRDSWQRVRFTLYSWHSSNKINLKNITVVPI